MNGLLKLVPAHEALATSVGIEIEHSVHGNGKIVALYARGGGNTAEYQCVFDGKMQFINTDDGRIDQQQQKSLAAADQYRYLSVDEGIIVKSHDRAADKVFLIDFLRDHLSSCGNATDLNKEYPRLNRHVHGVVDKSLSEYLNVEDQDQDQLQKRMKNVASLWANDILQQKSH